MADDELISGVLCTIYLSIQNVLKEPVFIDYFLELEQVGKQPVAVHFREICAQLLYIKKKTHASHGSNMSATTINNNNNTQSVWCKELGFPPPASPVRRAKTLATNSVLREPVDMLSFRSPRSQNAGAPELPLDFAAYIERSRAALESQRVSFERERAAFVQERRLWDTERMILKSRIAELEASADINCGGRGDAFVKYPQIRGSDFPPSSSVGGVPPAGGGTDRLNGAANGQHHVWEGPVQKTKPTRVFPEESNGQEVNHRSGENGADTLATLDSALPQTYHSIGIPGANIDGSLDGIRLKSSSLPSNFAAKGTTEPPEISLESGSPSKSNPGEKSGRRISLSNLGPPEVNLTKDAGHTPMAVIESGSEVSNEASNASYFNNGEEDDDEEEEVPLAPQTTFSCPGEQSNPCIPEYDEPDDDPALTGTLGLTKDETANNAFLDELDERLLDEARKVLSGPAGAETKGDGHDHDDVGGDGDDETNERKSDVEEPEPELRFRKTTNFGTAFGSTLMR